MSNVTDLAGWLTQVWDELQEIAENADGETFWLDEGEYTLKLMEALPPSSVLARIAADRKILGLHRHTTDPAGWIDCSTCGEQGKSPDDRAYAYCEHVRLLASPFADRPGYQESWAVQ